ncbi:MAG TPA: MerR family transcriptional regulator [Caulobacteraceae bacterium]|nr:MerR family transcriptional regulator [Caulobacteraceae bacterium]
MKGPEAFRTISEAADELGVAQHVLRFWESKFSFIRPMKRAGGRRFYRPQDLEVLRSVRALLRDEGYTIKGVQRLHKEQGIKRLLLGPSEDPALALNGAHISERPVEDSAPVLMFSGASTGELSSSDQARLNDVLNELLAAKARLSQLISKP